MAIHCTLVGALGLKSKGKVNNLSKTSRLFALSITDVVYDLSLATGPKKLVQKLISAWPRQEPETLDKSAIGNRGGL